jgi:alkylation response protein AidB-like acyl-CoA dehydrogenase
MNFDLGPDEVALRDGIKVLCARHFSIEKVRKGFDRDGWRALGEAGVFSLRLPEAQGGVGLGMTEAVIVFQQLGRALVPGPLVATHLAAGVVDGAATGERVITFREDLEDLLEFGSIADAAVLLGDDGQSLLEEPVGGEPVEPLDPLTPVSRITSGRAEVILDLNADRFRCLGAALTAALSSGIASKTVELAVAYAKEREQFGKPIGAFQAVKHMCADMLVRAEVARAAVDAAGVLLDADDPAARTAVASAKLLAGEAAIANSKTCIQVHGGMGFTWEVDAHLYLKRAAVLAVQFGGLDAQAELVAAAL